VIKIVLLASEKGFGAIFFPVLSPHVFGCLHQQRWSWLFRLGLSQ
jgi:hypothetical protein